MAGRLSRDCDVTHKMAASMSVANAAANGDTVLVRQLIQQGANVNEKSRDGMTPLSVAAFWGYADTVELLLQLQADVNSVNKNTLWTPLHCAAFQGHGKVIMKLMEHNPDLNLKDNIGRTAIDFASALDSIWPFFAAAKCKRTNKSDLIRMDIVQRVNVSPESAVVHQQSDFAHFTRPGSAYVMRSQPLQGNNNYSDLKMAEASMTGDVLAGTEDSGNVQNRQGTNPAFTLWHQ